MDRGNIYCVFFKVNMLGASCPLVVTSNSIDTTGEFYSSALN